jgi:hypothetical protein
MNVQPQIRAKRRAHRRRQTHDRHHKRGTDHGAANKKRARGGGPVKIVSLGFTSDGDANGGANADATALPSSRPSNLPGSQWRWRDLPTTAPGLAEPERREPIPHQLQRGPELSSSSLIAPFGDRMPCQRQAADSNQPLTAAQTESWEGATSIAGEYLRRGYQCMAYGQVPSSAQDLICVS